MKEQNKIEIKAIAIIICVGLIIAITSYLMLNATFQSPSLPNLVIKEGTYFYGFNTHQAIILIDNGSWSAIIPMPQNGTFLQFSSSDYQTVVNWAMNQTKLNP